MWWNHVTLLILNRRSCNQQGCWKLKQVETVEPWCNKGQGTSKICSLWQSLIILGSFLFNLLLFVIPRFITQGSIVQVNTTLLDGMQGTPPFSSQQIPSLGLTDLPESGKLTPLGDITSHSSNKKTCQFLWINHGNKQTHCILFLIQQKVWWVKTTTKKYEALTKVLKMKSSNLSSLLHTAEYSLLHWSVLYYWLLLCF